MDTVDSLVLQVFSRRRDGARIFDPRVKAWAPVDQYIGGVSTPSCTCSTRVRLPRAARSRSAWIEEPFSNLFNQGDDHALRGKRPADREVEVEGEHGSRPDPLINEMGADTGRVYTLFLGPPEDEVEWSDEAVTSACRFPPETLAGRRARGGLPSPTRPPTRPLEHLRHVTIQRVTRDFERLSSIPQSP